MIRLSLLARVPGVRPLAWRGAFLYAARGYELIRWDARERRRIEWERVASFTADPLRRAASSLRLAARLLRTGFQAVSFLSDGTIVAVLAKYLALLAPGARELVPAARFERGTRPLEIAVGPDDAIYRGDYHGNRAREAVAIRRSADRGRTWEVVHAFPAGSVRHVHCVAWDRWGGCFWACTGDEGSEPGIYRFPRDFSRAEAVVAGDQQARAATLVVEEECLYYATDTPHEPNRVYRLRRDGRRERLHAATGPCMYAARAGGALFFSAAAEPGRSYSPRVTIAGSRDLVGWERLVAWEKDARHPTLFQFGNAVLPRGENTTDVLAACGVAVRREDGVLNLWEVG